MSTPTFPVPTSGDFRVTRKGPKQLDLVITRVNADDHRSLLGFFLQMLGRFGAFRIELGGDVYETCHFSSDSAPFSQVDKGHFSVSLPIEVGA